MELNRLTVRWGHSNRRPDDAESATAATYIPARDLLSVRSRAPDDGLRLGAAGQVWRLNDRCRRNLPLAVLPRVRLLYLGTSRSWAVEPMRAPGAAQ